ncbi:GDSL esterase/lipase [Vitis vinifera]|uniref:GDSL esterase/lipase n=1 Tax=Vitis vinifera TaxID=29760 RepID=A0A438IC72_VITVI|nr:GDSL esterase/lipase [Vitis vinifera]
MDNQPLFIYLFLLLSVTITVAGAYAHANRSIELFVFGDSYVDTENRNLTASSWKEPYGITHPGRPIGHYSDGQVFTEYIGITSKYRCGDVEKGEKKYNVCMDPKLAFFWDSVDPTQAGWDASFSELGSSIVNLFQTEL